MKSLFSLLFSLLILSSSNAKEIRVGVLDTGFNTNVKKVNLCKGSNLVNFTQDKNVNDSVGHGTLVVSIIDDELKDIPHCFIIVKVLTGTQPSTYHNVILGWAFMTEEMPDVINYSAGGPYMANAEEILIDALLNNNVLIAVAAGNDGKNLDKECSYYPACMKDPRLYVCGNLNENLTRNYSSNYGKIVNNWNIGTNICKNGTCMSGTSMATAKQTAKLAKRIYYKSLRKENKNGK